MGTHLVLAVGVLILAPDGGHGQSHNNRLRIRLVPGGAERLHRAGSPLVTFSDTRPRSGDRRFRHRIDGTGAAGRRWAR